MTSFQLRSIIHGQTVHWPINMEQLDSEQSTRQQQRRRPVMAKQCYWDFKLMFKLRLSQGRQARQRPVQSRFTGRITQQETRGKSNRRHGHRVAQPRAGRSLKPYQAEIYQTSDTLMMY